MGELPEVVEGEHHGHATWSVRGKGIAWLRPFSKADIKRFGDQTPPAEPILAVNTTDLHEKEGVLAAGIHGVFTIQHFDNHPADRAPRREAPRRRRPTRGGVGRPACGARRLVHRCWLRSQPNDIRNAACRNDAS